VIAAIPLDSPIESDSRLSTGSLGLYQNSLTARHELPIDDSEPSTAGMASGSPFNTIRSKVQNITLGALTLGTMLTSGVSIGTASVGSNYQSAQRPVARGDQLRSAPSHLVSRGTAQPRRVNAARSQASIHLQEIESKIALPNSEIAERLFDVTYQAYCRWKNSTARPNSTNFERIIQVRDIIDRAESRHKSQDALTAWLLTPAGTRALSPLDLIRRGEYKTARFLAASHSRERRRPEASWLKDGPVQQPGLEERRRRDRIYDD
jgi:hypothetical protein